jgi:hypothetical protein
VIKNKLILGSFLLISFPNFVHTPPPESLLPGYHKTFHHKQVFKKEQGTFLIYGTILKIC